MKFGDAIELLRDGDRVRRMRWSHGEWIVHVPVSVFPREKITKNEGYLPADRDLIVAAAIGRYTPSGVWHQDWIPSVDDLFALDWEVFPSSCT